MADTKLSALATAVPVPTDYLYGAQAAGPTSKGFLFSAARDLNNMVYAALTIDTADVDAVVNTLHYATIAGLTAVRNWTLPATAAVGDRCGIFIADGDATQSVILKANTGDTLNGVSAAEWSRLRIINELVICRCVVANTTWVVEYDGRISTSLIMHLTTSSDGETGSVYTLPTAAAGTAGAWTAVFDNAFTADVTTDKFTAFRAGRYLCAIIAASKDALADAANFRTTLSLNSTTPVGAMVTAIVNSASGVGTGFGSATVNLATGDTLQFMYRTGAGSLGCGAYSTTATTLGTSFSVNEVL